MTSPTDAAIFIVMFIVNYTFILFINVGIVYFSYLAFRRLSNL